jgi:hypothetical protein
MLEERATATEAAPTDFPLTLPANQIIDAVAALKPWLAKALRSSPN